MPPTYRIFGTTTPDTATQLEKPTHPPFFKFHTISSSNAPRVSPGYVRLRLWWRVDEMGSG